MSNLIDLYKRIQSSVGLVSDNEGFVSSLLPGGDTPKPFMVNGKRLVLPTPNQLEQPDWSKRIGFHPFLQNLTGGESQVMERFRDRMNGFADYALGMLILDLTMLGINKDMHKDLTPEQASYLGPISDADPKFLKLVRDMVMTKRVQKKGCEFIRFSVIKGRVYQGQKRSRVAVMHFPLYEALPKENKPCKIGPFSLRVADTKMIRNLYEFLFTGIREPGHYEEASDSKQAPSMEALMTLYARYTDVQNKAVAILEPVISTSNQLFINNDWRDDIANIGKYTDEIRAIPFLEGNTPSERVVQANVPQRIGETSAAAKTVVATDGIPVVPQAMIQQPAPAQPEPRVQQQPAAPRTIKLGQKAPTIEGNVSHQITDQQARDASAGLSYRQPPLTANIPPTQPVGSYLPPAQPVQSPVFQQPVQPVQQVQPMKLPESARYYNGVLYIPLDTQGAVGAPPAGSIMMEGKLYVPMVQPGMVAPGMGMPGMVPGMAMNPMMQRQMVPGMNAPITDPAQVPGLSPEEIQYYRGNPVMFQNYLQQLNVNNMALAQAQQVNRQPQTPRYLRNAIEQHQAQQQNQFTTQGFLNRR